jgi:TrmH family RNA methyltransferase
MQLKRYKREFDHSYAFGVFPTLELLTHRPREVLKVVVHSKGSISSGIGKIETLCTAHGIPFERNDTLVERLSHKENIYVFGVFRKYVMTLEPLENHLMLVNPSDMGNLGTIARTMLGFGVRNLAIVTPAVDAFNPHVVRASMGGVFALNMQYFAHVEAYRQAYRHQLYAFMLDAQHRLDELRFVSPHTLVFGPEGPGLPDAYRQLGESVVIPQGPLIESLNLGVAVGIALYETTRGQR